MSATKISLFVHDYGDGRVVKLRPVVEDACRVAKALNITVEVTWQDTVIVCGPDSTTPDIIVDMFLSHFPHLKGLAE